MSPYPHHPEPIPPSLQAFLAAWPEPKAFAGQSQVDLVGWMLAHRQQVTRDVAALHRRASLTGPALEAARSLGAAVERIALSAGPDQAAAIQAAAELWQTLGPLIVAGRAAWATPE